MQGKLARKNTSILLSFIATCVLLCVLYWNFTNTNMLNLPILKTSVRQLVTSRHNQSMQPTPVTPSKGTHQSVRNVYYLKVHKTGSTTFSNILNRFGMREDCTFACFTHYHAYPTTNMVRYLLPHPKDLHAKSLWSNQKKWTHKFNIVSVHTVYNLSAIQLFMPNNTSFVATIRHPLSQMISAFYHYRLDRRLNMTTFKDPIRQFLTNPAMYDKPLAGSLYNRITQDTGIKLSFTRNRMAFEFGFNLDKVENTTYVKQHLLELDGTFDVMLMTEHYEESLLLLKERFHWTYKDIIFLPLRSQRYKEKGVDFERYGELYENHQIWASLDYAIYDHFLKKHKRMVSEKGSAFKKEVRYFKILLKEISNFCVPIYNSTIRNTGNTTVFGKYMQVHASEYHSDFIIEAKECLSMAFNDTFFNNIIFSKQYKDYCKNSRVNKRFRNFLYKNRCVKRIAQNALTLYGFPLKLLRKKHFLTL